MIRVVFRKILNNKWLIICLLIGCILAVAVVSSIPIYSQGILQRMLLKDFENSQNSTEIHPAILEFNGTFNSLTNQLDKVKLYDYYNNKIYSDMATNVPMDIVTDYSTIKSFDFTAIKTQEWDEYKTNVEAESIFNSARMTKVKIVAFQNEDYFNMLTGKMYSNEVLTNVDTEGAMANIEKLDKVYEVIVSDTTLKNNNYSVNGIYRIVQKNDDTDVILNVKVVGVYNLKEEYSAMYGPEIFGFYMSPELFYSDFLLTEKISLAEADWFFAYDYYQLSLKDTQYLNDLHIENDRWIADNYGLLNQKMLFSDILSEYLDRSETLSGMLILLIIPVLLMIGFYVSMIAQLIMEQEKNEIAMLESRGASRLQIFKIYLYESIFIGVISYGLGLLLSLYLCKMLGASNGFMEFVNRSALTTDINVNAFIYGGLCTLFFIAMILLPAYKASKFTIVQFKQGKNILGNKPFWQKLYLDVVLLVVSIWALNNYNTFKDSIGFTGEGQVDYLVFFAVTFFILGVSLVFMRFYPYLVNLIFRVTKRYMTPSMYASFTYVGRGGNMRQYIMIFLILALGVGIFSANSARTINENLTNSINYMRPYDISLKMLQLIAVDEDGNPDPEGLFVGEDTSSSAQKNIDKNFKELEDNGAIIKMTKVITEDVVLKSSTSRTYSSEADPILFGIIPEEYGQVVWYTEGLLDVHINYYLNLLAENPKGVIITSDVSEEIIPGDYIKVFIDNESVEVPVLAIVDDWPGRADIQTIEGEDTVVSHPTVIMHYTYLKSEMGDLEADAWVKKSDDLLDSEFLDLMEEYNVKISSITFTDYEISDQKKDPMILGMNGILTLGFLVTMIICGAGFVIFWIISIRQRVLQFGIFRAMGMKKRELISIIFWEQLLISAVAIIAGVFIGSLSSSIFVPLFELVNSANQRVMEFRIYSYQSDYIRIYIIVGAMLIVGISAIARFITHIKMDQAVKLGED